MPLDLLDRIMIIRTLPYGLEDMIEVRLDFSQEYLLKNFLIRSFEYVRKLNKLILQMILSKHLLKLEMYQH
jgi:DNA helicase TIP49 (TBP-interacting protein)